VKTNTELRAALHMVLARLDADSTTVEEWDAIRSALDDAARYAGKVRALRAKLETYAPPHPKGKCGSRHCSCAHETT
jgi:hypothetical protein